MTEPQENKIRDGADKPSRSPVSQNGGSGKNPRQGGERRYERHLEADPSDEDEDDDGVQSREKSPKPSPERVKNYVAYTIKLPSDQLSALQSIWLELKKLYGSHSPDKSGMIQAAIDAWLKRWDGPEHDKLLEELLDIRQSTRRRQYRKGK